MPSDMTRANPAPPIDLALLVARILMVAIFPISGYYKAIAIGPTTKYFTGLGAPMPEIAVYVAIFAEFVLPLLILLGVKTRWAAIGLILYTLGTSLIGHRFWDYSAATQYAQYFGNLMSFMKNICMVAGLGLIALLGPGAYSVEKRP